MVVDAQGVPGGIFTTVDLLESVAAGAPLDAPVSAHMTPRPVSLEEEATLADAALAMARHGFRHIVVTRDGKLAGVVSERDLFALQRLGLRRTAERIRGAVRLEQLVEAARDIRQLTRHLLAQGVAAGPLTAMVSALNDALSRRVIELAAARRALAGALVLARARQRRAHGADPRHRPGQRADRGRRTRRRSSRFADQVNRDLDACGFPLCKGDIMARNPRWCLTPRGMARACSTAGSATPIPRRCSTPASSSTSAPLAGDARLAGALRDAVLAQTKANRAFCRAMAQAALQARPPLGLLERLLGRRARPQARRRAPVRRCRARAGARRGRRRDRHRGAAAGRGNEATAVEAFHYVQTLRLRRESNRVRVAELNDIERRVLKGAFRQAALLQQRLRLDLRLVSWFRRTPLEGARWVVIDCETSGLDAARDRLLSVGAVAVRDGVVDLQDFFEASDPAEQRRARARTS